ncbi:DNA internalization-related competence protein ComEC/Rec2 [Neptuniibacter caesariensis]|uniref:DNA internalization-related competence protein n=1 Tax=Neptuniibacter caesariensis TaxID=207954 RepID=A0A7U8GTB9_NEPCE|nr:DNA internalization-related competence protein ComEC/Rec2 [Neptuniibacter caesariensis]EAR62137.1 DNA internalization-related competence protein [Oceanospirillum sp. MED92] [Neptuniibacter caesariensis]
MRSRMIAVTTGFLLAASQPKLLPVWGYIFIAVSILLLRLRYPDPSSKGMMLVIAGLVYSSLFFHAKLTSDLPEQFARTDWQIKGKVETVKYTDNQFVRFQLIPLEIKSVSSSINLDFKPERVRLAWFRPDQKLYIGQEISLVARLKPPHGQVNPKNFDYEKWLFARGINAVGYVRQITRAERNGGSVADIARHWINQTIVNQFKNQQVQGLYQAISTGNTNLLTSDNWETLKQTGTVHLAVISGLHIGFMAGMGWIIGMWVLRRLPSVSSMPYLLSISLAAGYLAISGFGLPAQRAFIMVTVLLLTSWRGHFIDHWTRWWIALVVVLLIYPMSVYETGFWLSFAAVALLILLSASELNLIKLFCLQFKLLIGMLPLYLVFFAGVSLVAPLINLIAIPLFSVLVPLLLIHLIMSSIGIELLKYPLSILGEWFWITSDKIASFNLTYVSVELSDLLGISIVALSALLVISRIFAISRTLIFIVVLPLLLGVVFDGEHSKPLKIWIYDIGQGLAVFLKKDKYHLLYDTGPSYRSGGAAFERAVLPHLKSLRVETINDLIISHDDNDHSGGRETVYSHFDVLNEYSSRLSDTSKWQLCHAGTRWLVEGVSFTFLHGSVGSNDNDRSCVLLIEHGDCKLLLPGDIGKDQELRLVNALPRVTWLVASHHGSNSSSSHEFLKATQPDVTIFSAGYANHFNHPHPLVIERVSKLKGEMLNTAEQGAIYLESDLSSGCSSISLREEQPRLWR